MKIKPISLKDVAEVAKSLRMNPTLEQMNAIVEDYPSAQEDDSTSLWLEVIEQLLYQYISENEQEKSEKKNVYVLFGESASKAYHSGGVQDVLSLGGFQVKEFAHDCNPLTILDAYDGWNGYATITKEDYDILSQSDNQYHESHAI